MSRTVLSVSLILKCSKYHPSDFVSQSRTLTVRVFLYIVEDSFPKVSMYDMQDATGYLQIQRLEVSCRDPSH